MHSTSSAVDADQKALIPSWKVVTLKSRAAVMLYDMIADTIKASSRRRNANPPNCQSATKVGGEGRWYASRTSFMTVAICKASP